MNLKKVIRKILHVRTNESINDYFYRKNLYFQKFFFKKKFSYNDLQEALKKLGIKNDDSVMVHSSYRAFFNFDGTPEDIINILIDLVGTNGNIFMPCFGSNKFVFNVDTDPSMAGALSECFRKHKDVIRSKGSHFACAGYGKDKTDVLKDHELSIYGFDKYSPYYKFSEIKNSKILMMGLGKYSVKLSLYHVLEMQLKDQDPFYKSLFNKTYSSIVRYKDMNGEIQEIKHNEMLLRDNTVPNKKNIKKIYKQNFVKSCKVSNVDLVVINVKEALKYILEEAQHGNYMIKKKIF